MELVVFWLASAITVWLTMLKKTKEVNTPRLYPIVTAVYSLFMWWKFLPNFADNWESFTQDMETQFNKCKV